MFLLPQTRYNKTNNDGIKIIIIPIDARSEFEKYSKIEKLRAFSSGTYLQQACNQPW
jgi:hypothetical protein